MRKCRLHISHTTGYSKTRCKTVGNEVWSAENGLWLSAECDGLMEYLGLISQYNEAYPFRFQVAIANFQSPVAARFKRMLSSVPCWDSHICVFAVYFVMFYRV
jgi:hypothetical protein